MRVSFIVPVFDTDIDVLRLSVNSILKAAGNEHELVLVEDESRRPETRPDSRRGDIRKYRYRTGNGLCGQGVPFRRHDG